ncbi:DUF4374 domain-containing protein [Fodinibius saliphilus]|uniref:DUF4374 domain-containing protein n=1 Tax=Fodinibius saliphilus TaxID=1920650 RepID=UPI0011093384|nr:DUF4374 domain-containing protein [Fodinibius saliphilus]
MKLNRELLLLLIFVVSMGTGCDIITGTDDNNDGPANYTIAFTAQGSENESTDYIFNTEDLMEGSLSAEGIGIEQTGWRYMAAHHNTLFSIGYYDDNNAIAYELDNEGNVVEKGRFVFENTLDMVGKGDSETMLAMEVPRVDFADRVLHKVDVNAVSIKEKVNMRIWENKKDSLVAWPTALKVRNNKLFVPFYKIHARGDFTTPKTDTAYVAVYSYPEIKFEKYITDTRMGPIGVYGLFNGMVSDESGNLYGYSSASLANGFTTQGKSSGILRINDGETEFDSNYFFNVEAATGGKINFLEYVGNGKALANIVVDDSQLWGSYSAGNEIHKLVVLDLENKTATDVSGVPLHGGFYGSPWYVDDGNVYMSVTTAESAHVYKVDIASATATKGAEILGKELKGIYNLNKK